jgi:hypothetical protein
MVSVKAISVLLRLVQVHGINLPMLIGYILKSLAVEPLVVGVVLHQKLMETTLEQVVGRHYSPKDFQQTQYLTLWQ